VRKRIQFVIPAAGLGSRFIAAGYTTIKPLIPVGSLPMILWPISNIPLEPQDILIIITKKGDNLYSIKNKWLKNIKTHILFIEMDSLSEGPASTVEAAMNKIDLTLPLVVLNSDQYITSSILEFIEDIRNNKAEVFGSILTMKASGNKWSYVERNARGEIDAIVEKKEVSAEATVGVYAWSSAELFASSLMRMKTENLRVNNEFYIAPSYNYLIIDKVFIKTFHVGTFNESVYGLGTPEDLADFLSSTARSQNEISIVNRFKYLNE
jgi:NDP-sugar pyrophosphorylase family protein